ncbi:MAG: nucleotidyltransferase domain-containing protein [Phycisphaerae bacterium]|nr:nucleotidyltransferase domain-containing protein [Tepidisphaeraceae bacterium]
MTPTSPQSDPRLHRVAGAHAHPLLFATISGAHLYGFPSPDSDFDLRGVHLLPARTLLSLDVVGETLEQSGIVDGLEVDLVTHDLRKFMKLMLRKNGYVLEQLLSPLIVRTSAGHEELKAFAPRCITRFHAYHYLGFALTQWKLFEKETPPRAKPLCYVYRVLLTGIHLMRTGRVEANLVTLNDEYRLPYVPDLIARKTTGGEHSTLTGADLAFHRAEYDRLRARLEDEMARSTLPEAPTARAAMDDLLLRLRGV